MNTLEPYPLEADVPGEYRRAGLGMLVLAAGQVLPGFLACGLGHGMVSMLFVLNSFVLLFTSQPLVAGRRWAMIATLLIVAVNTLAWGAVSWDVLSERLSVPREFGGKLFLELPAFASLGLSILALIFAAQAIVHCRVRIERSRGFEPILPVTAAPAATPREVALLDDRST